MTYVSKVPNFRFRFGEHARTIAMTPEKYANDAASEFLETERGRFILAHMKAMYDEIIDRLKNSDMEEVAEQMVCDYRIWSGYEMTGGEIFDAVYEIADEDYREKCDTCIKNAPQPVDKNTWGTNQEEVIRTIVSILSM